MQIAPILGSIMFSNMATLALPFSFTLSHEWHNFCKKLFEHKMCVLIISASFVWNISHSTKNSARYYHKFIYVYL